MPPAPESQEAKPSRALALLRALRPAAPTGRAGLGWGAGIADRAASFTEEAGQRFKAFLPAGSGPVARLIWSRGQGAGDHRIALDVALAKGGPLQVDPGRSDPADGEPGGS